MKTFRSILVLTIDYYDDESDSHNGNRAAVIEIKDPISGFCCAEPTDSSVTNDKLQEAIGDCTRRYLEVLNKWPDLK